IVCFSVFQNDRDFSQKVERLTEIAVILKFLEFGVKLEPRSNHFRKMACHFYASLNIFFLQV
ncbi:hypothetical protein, partial [Flavitalea sp.]|nr:hypothetical protein [Flavitalea sp.]